MGKFRWRSTSKTRRLSDGRAPGMGIQRTENEQPGSLCQESGQLHLERGTAGCGGGRRSGGDDGLVASRAHARVAGVFTGDFMCPPMIALRAAPGLRGSGSETERNRIR